MAQTVLRHVQLAESTAADVRNRATGVVRIGAPMVLAGAILPAAVRTYLAQRPKVVIRIRDTPVDARVDQVASGDIDLAVAQQLAAQGFAVCTALDNRSNRSRKLAQQAGLTDLGNIQRPVAECDLVLSIMRRGRRSTSPAKPPTRYMQPVGTRSSSTAMQSPRIQGTPSTPWCGMREGVFPMAASSAHHHAATRRPRSTYQDPMPPT